MPVPLPDPIIRTRLLVEPDADVVFFYGDGLARVGFEQVDLPEENGLVWKAGFCSSHHHHRKNWRGGLHRRAGLRGIGEGGWSYSVDGFGGDPSDFGGGDCQN
ncbi:hypothetical protein ACOSP7_009976 [Xanthoceras sorbifolium]